MLKVNDKAFIKSYKQYKKDIKLIRVLLQNTHARYRWCRKRKINFFSDSELKDCLALKEHELSILEKFIVRNEEKKE